MAGLTGRRPSVVAVLTVTVLLAVGEPLQLSARFRRRHLGLHGRLGPGWLDVREGFGPAF